MEDATLLMLANEVRGKTLRLLNDVTPELSRFTGHDGLNNSILWHAGHAVVVVEHLAIVPAVNRIPEYPVGWGEIFGAGSKPATVTIWPSLNEVVAVLSEQLGRLQDAIRLSTPSRIDQVIDADRNRTLRYSILHGLHDEAIHQGEMLLLKKMWGKRTV
jgi:hypothetical protein